MPSSDLPVDRGVTHERRRLLHIEAWPQIPNNLTGVHAHRRRTASMMLTNYRRAKAIEKELHKRANDGATCAELAALLQE